MFQIRDRSKQALTCIYFERYPIIWSCFNKPIGRAYTERLKEN
jgi:hypothetical protein